MKKFIIILFVALALLQFVRSEDGEAAASGDGSSDPVSDLTNKGVDAAKEGAEKAKAAVEKGLGQLREGLKTVPVFGSSKSGAEKSAK